MIYLPYKRYQCEYCGTYITVIYACRQSYLPVELDKEVPVYRMDEYDKEKHISHLKNCEQMQKNWRKIKYDIFRYYEQLSKRYDKSFMR